MPIHSGIIEIKENRVIVFANYKQFKIKEESQAEMFGFFYIWKMEETNEIIISDKQRPFWQRVLAAFFYTIVIVCIWVGYYRMTHPYLYTLNEYRNSVVLMEIAIFPLLFGINYSLRKKIYINSESKRIRNEFSIGPINFNVYSKIKEFKYVSVFFDANNEAYILNLWYKVNKFYCVCSTQDFDSAMDLGKILSKKLNIDLLDATEKGSSKWVEI